MSTDQRRYPDQSYLTYPTRPRASAEMVWLAWVVTWIAVMATVVFLVWVGHEVHQHPGIFTGGRNDPASDMIMIR
jgi:hypothetical protein